MRVLIFGGRAPVALDHARRLHGQGAHVVIADSVSCRLSSSSTAAGGSVRLPSPRYEVTGFIAAVREAVSRHSIDLVLPTCEEVFFLSRWREALPTGCDLFAPPFELLRSLHSKIAFQEAVAGCGAELPESFRVRGLDEAREWARGRPVVLKPEFSRFGVHVRLHPEGIPSRAPPLPPLGSWIVQEYCVGRELCSYAMAREGRLTAFVTYEPTYRLARSSSYYFEPVQMPGIRDFVRRFVARHQFTGQVSFDWIVRSDGRIHVLECNPRASSGLHLFSATDPLRRALVERSSPCVEPEAPTPRMVAAVMATAGLQHAVRSGALSRWWRDWRRASDVLAGPHDRAPALGALFDIGAFAAGAYANGCSLREAATRDIEWDGEELHA